MIDDCGKNLIYPINVMFQDTYLKKKKKDLSDYDLGLKLEYSF